MLQVVDLVKDYKKLRAVKGVSFEVNPGEIVGLLGPNGAGKTSLLRCCAGILRPTTGQVLINGYDLLAQPTQAKQRMSFVPELPNLYELLTVEEHLRFIAMAYGTLPVYEEMNADLLERYDLADKRTALVATLSKGMRQKLSIAGALIHNANVLLFDEPMIGVDPAGVAEFKQEIQRAKNAGAAVLISTHLLDTAERLCDRLVIMARGQRVFSGTLTELREQAGQQQATLEALFLELTEESLVESPPLPH